MAERMYFLDTKYGCGAVVVKDDKVSKTCPLYKWMIGKGWGEVLNNLVRANALKRYEALPNVEDEENGGILDSVPENNGA